MRPLSQASDGSGSSVGAVRLGVPLTLLLMAVYFGFIGLGTFAPQVLAMRVWPGSTVTLAFAYGLLVIALGVVLTGLYVWLANRASGPVRPGARGA